MERQKAAQRAQKDVQRVLQTATESENRLGVALKVGDWFIGVVVLGGVSYPALWFLVVNRSSRLSDSRRCRTDC